jgi:hypothetical protein
MAVETLDVQAFLDRYVTDLNKAVETREFAPFIKKWFADDGLLSFKHEAHGIEKTKTLWTHLVPKGENVPREVVQHPYKIENGRVYAWRALQGGILPHPLYGEQETQFDDRTLISDLRILSVPKQPDVVVEEGVERSRLGRIFQAFADAFNDYFQSGDVEIVAEWASDDIHVYLENTFWGMDIMAHYMRTQPTVRFSVKEWEQLDENRFRWVAIFKDWGGLEAPTEAEFLLTPEGKISQSLLYLDM